MEKPLDQYLEEVLASPGVVGVLCTDAQGLCLSAKGKANHNTAGVISAIASLASELEPDSNQSPVVQIESTNMRILIQNKNGVTAAIYKKAV